MTTYTPKGEVRRQQVLEAASGVLIAEGFRALTHRRVAQAAGVPLGTTTYYFTSRGDLVRATVGLLIEDERRRRAGVRVQDVSIPSVARALVELLLPPAPASPRDQASLLYERLAEGVRDPLIADLIREDYAGLEAHVARVIAVLPSAPDAGTVLALADGRVLRWLVSQGGTADLEDLVASDLRWLGQDVEPSAQVAGSSAAAVLTIAGSADSSERRPSTRISRHQPTMPTRPKSSHCTE